MLLQPRDFVLITMGIGFGLMLVLTAGNPAAWTLIAGGAAGAVVSTGLCLAMNTGLRSRDRR